MTKKSKKTKKDYEKYLNEIGCTLPYGNFVIAGKQRYGYYGYLLRKYDPIAFEVGYNEWRRE